MRLMLAFLALLSAAASLQLHAQRAAPVVIRRVMADPVDASDAFGEWLELENTGERTVDLRGWQLRSGGDRGFVIASSLAVTPHGTVTLGRSADRQLNGGVRVDLEIAGITLGNRADWISLVDAAGRTVDSVAWSSTERGRVIEHEAVASMAPSVPAPRAPASPVRSVPALTRSELVVRVLDVGQGDAILIQNGGSNVLIDGGPNPVVLGRHLDALGLNGATIDAVILTHPHADHYQGLHELFAARRHITVRYFWENGDPSPNTGLARLRDSIGSRVRAGTLTYRDTDDPCATGKPLCTVELRGGARLHIMRPDPQGPTPNNRSPALKLVGPDSASFTMWMAGDAEYEAIDYFDRIADYGSRPGMRVDVLKADHHGSCNGVTSRYLELTRPSLVVASLGAVNDYGHMHEQAKALYARGGALWYRTDQNGAITLRSPGTPGGGWAASVEREGRSLSGPSDRRSTSPACR